MTAAKTTRKQLQPFGGINGRAEYQRLKEQALLTKPRQECFDMGFLTVKDLDDEELRYGRCRDDRGRIPRDSKKTELIPKEQYEAMVQEHELRYKQKLRQRLDDMIDIMTDIAKDETVEPRDRFEAARYLFERTAGKTPETVNINVKTAPWEDLLTEITGIASVTRAQHREVGAGIIDVEAEDITDEMGNHEAQEHYEGQPHETTQTTEHSGEADTSTGDFAQEYAPEVVEPPPERPEADALSDTEEHRPRQDMEPAPTDDVGGERFEYKPMYYSEGDIATTHDNQHTYGRRADENRSYAEQARAADHLAQQRRERRQKVQAAKKQRKIARAMGADAIKDEITGATLSDDGQVTFDATDNKTE
jgi:hypothetical protein